MGHLKEGRELDVSVEPRTLRGEVFDIPAVHARPDGMPRAGVVLHPDMGGLRPLFDDMARRIATYGLAVCAVEPFAAIPEDERVTIEQRIGHVKDLEDRYQLDMLSVAADLLVVEDGVSRVCVLGFCMGGYYTFKAAAADRFDAAVAFYGMLRTPDGRPTRGRPPPTSKRCGPRGPDGTTARSRSSKAPTTASSTIPSARCTAPTTRPCCGSAR